MSVVKRVYRVIEYEIRKDNEMDQRWLDHTLKMSIDGRYKLPNGCKITAIVAEPFEMSNGEPVLAFEHALSVADFWQPPHASARQRTRGDT